MMTMEQRIEAAAEAMPYPPDGMLAAEVRATAVEVLRSAFPELFDGTAWLAPMEPTGVMRVAGWPHFSALGDKPNGALEFAGRRYAAMRDAHLTPAGRETSKDGDA